MKLLFFIFLLTLPFLHSLDLEVFKQKMLENYQIVHSALLASRSQFQSDSERSVPPNTPNTEQTASLNFLEIPKQDSDPKSKNEGFATKDSSDEGFSTEPINNKLKAEYIVCSQIKKEAKQKLYCEDKYLATQGEKAVVACFTNFCSNCCEDFSDNDCLSLCHHSHIDLKLAKEGDDPEEIFSNVCASEKMLKSMQPFCSKFYDASPTVLKLCHNSFCFDCCVSELKIADENDFEIKKCTKKCLDGLKTIKFDEIEEKTSLSSNVNLITAPSENATLPLSTHAYCNFNESDIFCLSKIESNSSDIRAQSLDTCKVYFCPLCCADKNKGFEILNCQKSCHLSSIQSTEAAADFSNQTEVELKSYRFKSNQKQKKKQTHNQTNSLKKEELSFLSSLCQASNLTNCHNDVCNFSCKLNKPKSFTYCYDNCLNNINQSPKNQKATKILSFWASQIRQIGNKTDDKVLERKGNLGLEEEIEEREGEVEKMKKDLLSLEEEVLKLRKRKIAELAGLKNK